MMKHKKINPFFLAFVLLLACVLTFTMMIAINAKYVQKTDTSVLYFNIVPLTYDCILDEDVDVHSAIYNATNVPVGNDSTMSGAEILADIEILYFSSYERNTYTESGDGVSRDVPKTGSDFTWSAGIDVGLTVSSVRFFYDAATKTGFIISRRAEAGSAPNIIQANALSARLFSPSLDASGLSWAKLREVYFLDYGGVFDVETPAQVPAAS